MATITLSVWTLAAAVGLPGICLIWIVARLIRRRSNAMRAAAAPPQSAHPAAMVGSGRFRDDLLAQQIDIIFNGLTALIETERVKCRTLIGQGQSLAGPTEPAMAAREDQPREAPAAEAGSGDDIGQKVADAMSSGQGAEDIAAQLGLSQAEVVLAMKLHQAQSTASYRKLEAVA